MECLNRFCDMLQSSWELFKTTNSHDDIVISIFEADGRRKGITHFEAQNSIQALLKILAIINGISSSSFVDISVFRLNIERTVVYIAKNSDGQLEIG